MRIVTPWACLWVLVCVSAWPAAGAVQQTYYVAPANATPPGNDSNPGTLAAPFRTLTRARDEVRTIRGSMTGDIVVYLRGGRYPVTAPVDFTPNDGGTNGFNVIYSSYPGEIAQLSGGRLLTGWTAGAGSTFTAPLGGGTARQLFINGVPALRARHPTTFPPTSGFRILGVDDVNHRIQVSSSDVGSFGSALTAAGTEIMMNATFWQDSNFVTAVQDAGGGRTWLTLRNTEDTIWSYINDRVYYFANHASFLDSPGEFYVNPGASTVTYWPRAGENLATATVIIPQVTKLITLTGTFSTPVTHLQFLELRFEHSTFTDADTSGLTRAYDAQYEAFGGWTHFPALMDIVGATHLLLQGNVFRHTAAGALAVSALQDSTITCNTFTDLGAFGLYLRSPGEETDTRAHVARVQISNNYVSSTGRDYTANQGITSYTVQNLTISHNLFENLSGGAVSMTRTLNAPPADTNRIQFNRVTNAMSKICDWGGYYVYGNHPNSEVFENVFTNVRALCGDGPAVYCDDGYDASHCTGWLFKNNVFSNNDVDMYLNQAWDNTVYNFTGTLWQNGSNTFLTDGTFNPSAVQANAGIPAGCPAQARATEDQGITPPLGLPVPTNLRLSVLP